MLYGPPCVRVFVLEPNPCEQRLTRKLQKRLDSNADAWSFVDIHNVHTFA